MLDTQVPKSASKVKVRRTTDEVYRHFRLIAGEKGRKFSAVAYAEKTMVFTGSGSDLEAALDDVKGQIDYDFRVRAEGRAGELPSAAELELALALTSRRISPLLQQLMHALDTTPEIYPRQIVRRTEADMETLLRDLLRLARAIAAILDITLPKGSGNAAAALGLVAEQIDDDGDADGMWTFRAEFTEAAKAHLGR